MKVATRSLLATILLLAVSATTSIISAADGDTVRVKTLTFSDITKRSGTWLFPPPDRYEKVLMEYTLKCDPATTQDNYPCGEWDYLTYTILTDSTGEYDSTRLTQVNYVVRRSTPDSFAYATQFTAPLKRYRTTNVSRAGGANGTWYDVGATNQSTDLVIKKNGARSRFLWKASDLEAAGIVAGPISGISVTALDSVGNIELFTVRIGQTTASSVDKFLKDDGLTTVVRRTVTLDDARNELPFSSTFNWDGTSNLLIEFSCNNAPKNVRLAGGATSVAGVVDDGTRYVYSFRQADQMQVNGDIGAEIGNEITISFWSFGNANELPVNNSILEAYDDKDRRVLNIHMPWENGTVYWDAGRDPNSGAYDRIEKAASSTATEGQWNHWTFTKNAATGVMNIYLNGEVFHTGNGKSRNMTGIKRMVIGAGSAGSYRGMIDEFQVWNKVLTQTEIKSWMNRHITDLHPNATNLLAVYSAENDTDPLLARDGSASAFHASLFGLPTRDRIDLDQMGYLTESTSTRPAIGLEAGSIPASPQRVDIDVPQSIRRTSVIMYERPVQPRVYATDAPDHPAVPTDTLIVQQAGWIPILDEAGLKVDSQRVVADVTLRKVVSPYYSPIVQFEIGRYITPYGIGLDLGPNGFKWVYDVTDFAPLLRNNVTLSAGNQQELIDLTFIFIKGTPARDVKQIDQVWYERSAMFPDVLTNKALAPVDVPLNPEAKTFKLKAVTSGHDFSNATNCAEFCKRDHFFAIDGQEKFVWPLWKECGDNPVYPQGGTWLIDRTGWCPGAPVDLYEFELTSLVQGKSSVNVDYGVKKGVPEENWGRWEVSGQLIGYSAPNFTKDAAVVDVISPNSWEFYGRLNPICGEPVIVIQNTGSTALTSATINYGVVGGEQSTYLWTGNLQFLDKDTVTLPVPAWTSSESAQTFEVEVAASGDEYASNNTQTTSFITPPKYYSDLQIVLRTNNLAAQQYEWVLRKIGGDVVKSGKNLSDNTTYTDSFDLEDGCYEYELINKEGYGLDFWFLRDQLGTGSLQFRSGGVTIKAFEPDFGNNAWIQFSVGAKPTIQVNADTLYFSTPTPQPVERTSIITSGTSEPLVIDSVNTFSVRNHYRIAGTSRPLPTTLMPGESLEVRVTFDRPDNGTTSGSLRIYNNDERASVRTVRLVGTVGATSVDEASPLAFALEAGVVPNPITADGEIIMNILQPELVPSLAVVIYDAMGREMVRAFDGVVTSSSMQFAVPSTLPSGSYTMVVETAIGRLSSPFVVTR